MADLLDTLKKFLETHKAESAATSGEGNNFVARGKSFTMINFRACWTATDGGGVWE